MKAMSWNIGSYYFLTHAVKHEKSFQGHPIRTIYFQPELNGEFVSSQITAYDPDIIFLQEISSPEDTKHIPALGAYPHTSLLANVHHEHSMLVAAKQAFRASVEEGFTLIASGEGMTFLPIHLNAHRAVARHADTETLKRIAAKHSARFVLLGDTNIWSRGDRCFVRNDRLAYHALTAHLTDVTSHLGSTTYFGLAFDKLFVSGDIKVKNITCPHIRSHFMDHYPLIADLTAER